jgi:hypothetical protein
LRAGEGGDRARPEDAVAGDQRAVEVARDRGDRVRERVWEFQPDVLSTT